MRTETVVVLAKSPVAGCVKTRLTPTFTFDEAAWLATAMIRDTLETVGEFRPRHTVIAWDGPLAAWLPTDAMVLPQRGQSLDERLDGAFADVLGSGTDRPTLLVGMDTPQLRPSDLDVNWTGADAVLGLCEDGGFWALGFRTYHPGAIGGVPMSTPGTGAAQLARMRALGLSVRLLPMMRDVDEPADAAYVASLVPDSRFGRLHQALVGAPRSPTILFNAAMAGRHVVVEAGSSSRVCHRLDIGAWFVMSGADHLVAARCEGPVLDIGCGPGRFVEALGTNGIPVLGVDICAAAVDQISRRGFCALLRDVRDRLPGEGRWGTVLLADGNIGIGGDPLALLRRCRQLVRPGGMALVETSPNRGTDLQTTITLRERHGSHSSPIPWAFIGAHRLIQLADTAGFVAIEEWRAEGRAFVTLRRAA